MNAMTIKCPHCSQDVSIDEALTHQFESTLKEQLLKEYQAQMEGEKSKWEREEKEKLWKLAQEKATEKITAQKDEELKALKDENEKRTKELAEARQMELQLRQEKNKLDDERRAFELDKQRQLDAEREKIRKETADGLLERHRLLDAEKEKKMQDMMKTIEELQQKANQGSQQLQGEVLELELENELRASFPMDEIVPVPKGVNGADIVQRVRDGRGHVCGTIVWESKRTKAWGGDWVQKLKEDLLRVKGDVAVLVSVALPDGVKNFGHKEGIYVTTFDCFMSLAMILRISLMEHNTIKLSVVGKNEKMEMVYNYFLSSEFQQRVSTISEAFSAMKLDLDNEKKVMAKIWSKREKEIERVVTNTVSMHGELQGLIGTALPQVDSLEPDSLLLGFEES